MNRQGEIITSDVPFWIHECELVRIAFSITFFLESLSLSLSHRESLSLFSLRENVNKKDLVKSAYLAK